MRCTSTATATGSISWGKGQQQSRDQYNTGTASTSLAEQKVNVESINWTINSVTLNGGSAVTVLPGASITAAVTGTRSVQIKVPEAQSGDVRAYWSQNAVPLEAGKSYVLSGYVKTDSVVSDPGFGAARGGTGSVRFTFIP